MRQTRYLVIIVVLVGCDKGAEPVAKESPTPEEPAAQTTRSFKEKVQNDEIVNIADDDPAMNTAIANAKKTVRAEFIPVLQKPRAGQRGFAIKYPVKDGKQHEHFWINGLIYDGKQFIGKLDNEPRVITNVKIGQKMIVSPDEISDWMYTDKGKLVGGFTLRAIRDQLKGREREEFDQAIPFKIE